MSDTATGPWGPFHDHIGEGLAHCADYLGRLQRSLAGEIASDRHYFIAKARALRDAAVGLLGRAHEAERWLALCDVSFRVDGDERSCSRNAGHPGAHDERPSPAERAGERAGTVGALATDVADALACRPGTRRR